MTEVNRDLIDAISDARRDMLNGDVEPLRVATAPMDTLTLTENGVTVEVETIWGMPVKVDDRVPTGTVAVVGVRDTVHLEVGR